MNIKPLLFLIFLILCFFANQPFAWSQSNPKITIDQNQLNIRENQRKNYTVYQQKQYQNLAQPQSTQPNQTLPLHPEAYGSIDLEIIQANYYFSSFAFPTWTVQTITFKPTQDTSTLSFLAYHFNVLGAKRLDTMESVNYRMRDENLEISLNTPLRANQSYTFEFEGMLVFECMNLDCYQGEDSVVYLDSYGLLLNPEFPQRDLYLLNLQFLSSDQNLSFAASGTSLEITPCLEGICWQYQAMYPNSLPAFVVLNTTAQSWNDDIDLYPPVGGSYDLIGKTADLALAFYGDLYFPYPYQRLNIVNMTDNLGVALGPMANVMFPAGLWWENGDFNDLYTQFILAHELAHQYFFNWVKMSDLSEAWMSEGFAEYSAQRFMENFLGNDLFRKMDYWQYMYVVPREEDTAISSFEALSSQHYFFLVYHKAASVLEMIRQRVENFDEIMKSYVNDFGLSFTTTSEFKDDLTAKTMLDWNAFFRRWLYQASYPIFDVSISPTQPHPTYSWSTKITIDSDEILGASVLMDLGVPFICERDGVELVTALYFEQAQENLEITCDGGEIDPNLSLLRRIRSQAKEDVDFSGVVDGIDLMKIYEKVEDGAYMGHPSWNDVLDLNADLYIDQNDFLQVYQSIGQGLP